MCKYIFLVLFCSFCYFFDEDDFCDLFTFIFVLIHMLFLCVSYTQSEDEPGLLLESSSLTKVPSCGDL